MILKDIPAIYTSAMIGALNISVWEGRKKDKGIEQDVADRAGARSKNATSVHKNLFVNCPPLEAIKSLRGEARIWFNKYTRVWDDNGGRLIPTTIMFELKQDFANLEKRFNTLVDIFVRTYATEISKQAFERGAMFNRDEYPDVSDIRSKFRFVLNTMPLPTSGDFRVDIGNEALKEVQEQYDRYVEERIAASNQDLWERLKTQVEWVRDRMAAIIDHDPDAVEEIKHTETVPIVVPNPLFGQVDSDGQPEPETVITGYEEKVVKVDIKKKRRPKLHDSMLDTGVELCSIMRDLNVTNDPKLEAARKMLENAMLRIDMDSLKESPEMQTSTKDAMQSILDQFDF
jgi:hypothetical protein